MTFRMRHLISTTWPQPAKYFLIGLLLHVSVRNKQPKRARNDLRQRARLTCTTRTDLDVVKGFWQSRALTVATELELADFPGDGPWPADTLSSRTETDASSLYRLMRGLEVFKQVSPERQRTGKRVRGQKRSLLAMGQRAYYVVCRLRPVLGLGPPSGQHSNRRDGIRSESLDAAHGNGTSAILKFCQSSTTRCGR